MTGLNREHDWEALRWLLLIYRVPQEPAAHRTYVWRRLKGLGAIYLQQAAAVLPNRPELREMLEELAARIRGYGGEVSLLQTSSPDEAWQINLIERFDQVRDAEYEEVGENVERLEDEIRRERRKGRLTFAQLEDVEAEWERLRRWHERILARDFFEAAGRAEAEAALERARKMLEEFSADVYAREGVHAESNGEADRPV